MQKIDKWKSRRIQTVRAVAILFVVMIHTAPGGFAQVWIRPFINSCVGIFLFLSGYLTNCNIEKPIAFYKKRIFRVLIPYIIWTLIYTAAFRDWSNLDYNLITTKASGQFYYVYVYIELVLITPILIRLINSRFRHLCWFIDPVMTIFVKYIPIWGG